MAPREALDYESTRELRAVVRATDGVTGAFADAALTVRVLDVNDCAPQWEHDEYRALVSEAAAPGELVLEARATDGDSGASGAVTYSLSAASGAESAGGELPFAVHSASGEVRVVAPLDAEDRAAYHLLLAATDAGRPPLTTTAHLFIEGENVSIN